jgi:hypothetical protein
MDKKKSKLVNGLTLDTKQRISDYDRHVAMSELNRHDRHYRIERIKDMAKDFVYFVLPYGVVVFLILTMMDLGG